MTFGPGHLCNMYKRSMISCFTIFFSFFLRTLIYSSNKILHNLFLSEFGLSSHCNVVAQEVLCI